MEFLILQLPTNYTPVTLQAHSHPVRETNKSLVQANKFMELFEKDNKLNLEKRLKKDQKLNPAARPRS